MISILIIEDTPWDMEGVERAFKRAFPGVVITTAKNVADGHAHILGRRGDDFDVVIADILLPSEAGETLPQRNSPEWDRMVNDIDRRRTMLVLTSAHIVGDLHDVTIIPKGLDWNERIVGAAAAHIIRNGIAEAIGSSTGPFGRQPDRLRGVGTIPLARVTRNIYLLWKHLDHDNREYVRQYFHIVESTTRSGVVDLVEFGARG